MTKPCPVCSGSHDSFMFLGGIPVLQCEYAPPGLHADPSWGNVIVAGLSDQRGEPGK